ncbi:MAG: SGNH/GDSL hydrolase family protein [Acetobacteraceae bacterium]|nr:SGNH/GDSL hydrolase family protein [Acetobacteraceae bacterium]
MAVPLLALAPPGRAAPSNPCPPDPAWPKLVMPHLRAALQGDREGLIVALGSSSTEGVAASGSARAYPAVLQAELSAELPHWHVAVLNRGVGGQDAPEELARMEADVVAVRPQLVIWQVGANAALHHASVGLFRIELMDGVQRLKQAGIDVILMDNQRTPRILASAGEDGIERALAQAASEAGVNLFSRSRLMDAWASEGASPAVFTASDMLHHNDRGYLCLGRALAHSIAASLAPPPA